MSGKGRRAHHDERALMFVGTRKGVFVYESDFDRQKWKRTGPFLHEQAVSSIAYDHRDGKSVLVATLGGGLHRTRDHGRTWEKLGRGLPSETLTHLSIGHLSEPGRLFVGLEPAGIAVSKDGGASFDDLAGFRARGAEDGWTAPARAKAAQVSGIVVHSAQELTASVGSGGVYHSADAGKTWTGCHDGFADVSRLVANPAKAERLYVAASNGVWRSDDAGETWVNKSRGLASPLSRTLAVSPSKPGTLFAVPLKEGRDEPPKTEGGLAVYRSTEGGDSWQRLSEGLPGQVATSVHPEALAMDTLDEEGLYLATASGLIFVSIDEGETWAQIASGLAPVLSLELITEQE